MLLTYEAGPVEDVGSVAGSEVSGSDVAPEVVGCGDGVLVSAIAYNRALCRGYGPSPH